MTRLLAIAVASIIAGCSSQTDKSSSTHWTVVDIEVEMGEEWEAGPPPGPPRGYTMACARCVRGNEVIYIYVDAYDFHIPGGLDVGDGFTLLKPLETLDRVESVGHVCYLVRDDDVAKVSSR